MKREELKEAMEALDSGQLLVDWIKENERRETPTILVEELRETFGKKRVDTAIKEANKKNIGKRFPNVISKMLKVEDLSVEDCERLIGRLQSCIVMVRQKMDEIS